MCRTCYKDESDSDNMEQGVLNSDTTWIGCDDAETLTAARRPMVIYTGINPLTASSDAHDSTSAVLNRMIRARLVSYQWG